MKKLDRRKIEELLDRRDLVTPPEGLAERIKGEIPERLPRAASEPRPRSRPSARWLLAASLLTVVTGGYLAYRVIGARPSRPPRPAGVEIAPPAGSELQVRRQMEARERQVPSSEALKAPLATPAPRAPRAGVPAERYPLTGSEAAVTERVAAEAGAMAEQARRDLLDSLEERGQRRAEPPAPGRSEAELAFRPRDEDVVFGIPDAPQLLAEAPVSGGADREGISSAGPEPRLLHERQPPPPAPSTGGTAEPNEQPYGDVFFEHTGVNPFVDVEDDPLSTFGLDVDTGSYTVTRRYLRDGHLPPPAAVRVEEFVNYFDYGDPPPSGGADFALYAEGSRTPFAAGSGYRLIRFAIRARDVEDEERRPAVLTFVIDVSGSMRRENRLGLVKRALELLLDRLGHDDRVGLVVYGTTGRVLLEPTADREAIRSAIERLAAEGSTNAEEGLVLGYELARRHFRRGAINRVILCSDGVANVGRTGADSILDRVRSEAERGIELTTVGFGMGNYNDVLMEQLADRGDGSYAYVDSLSEARRIFVENVTGTLQTMASDAKVQVEFNPAVVTRYRLLGYENRDVADERFRDDTVDAGEIGAGHGVTALYEVKVRPGARPRAPAATLRLRYRPEAADKAVEISEELRLGELDASWEKASSSLRLAATVAEFAEILKHTYWARGGDLDDLFRRVQEIALEFPGDAAVAELAGLIGRAAQLSPEN